jgi:RNA polymerase sigma-70 factor, ECF subfamily
MRLPRPASHETLCRVAVSTSQPMAATMTLRAVPGTDRDTIAKALAGDPAAERELYDRHVERVYRLVYRMAGDAETAREYTQDTFVRAFERLGTFRGESAFSTWLGSIAISVALNGLRIRKRRNEREQDLELADTIAGKRERIEPDLRSRLQEAMAQLPDGYRAVLVLHELEGYTHEEIGAMLGIEIGTSKAQLFRARARLREVLAPHAGDWNT